MSYNPKTKEIKRVARHIRLRKRVVGTSAQPRLCVHRSLKNFYAQLVDDTTGKTIFGMSTKNKDVLAKVPAGGNIQAAEILGEAFAAEAKNKGVKQVCFDRGGYLYHGRVKAFAEGARKGGLKF